MIALTARLLFGCAFGADEASVTAARELSRPPVEVPLRVFARLRRAELLLDRGDVRGAKLLLEELSEGDPRSRWATEASALLALVLAVDGQPNGAMRLARSLTLPADPRVRAIVAVADEIARAQSRQGAGPQSSLLDPSIDRALSGSHALTTCLRVVRAARSERPWLGAATAHDRLASRVLTALGVVEVVDPAGIVIPIGGAAEAAIRRAREALAGHNPTAAARVLEPWSRSADVDAHPRTQIELVTLLAITSTLWDRGTRRRGTSVTRSSSRPSTAPSHPWPTTRATCTSSSSATRRPRGPSTSSPCACSTIHDPRKRRCTWSPSRSASSWSCSSCRP